MENSFVYKLLSWLLCQQAVQIELKKLVKKTGTPIDDIALEIILNYFCKRRQIPEKK